MIKFKIRLAGGLFAKMKDDLSRPHSFAWERVGFAYGDTIKLKDGTVLLLLKEYIPVDDSQYIADRKVGARINSAAIQAAMQHIMDSRQCGFHVHFHNFSGHPAPSKTDNSGIPPVVDALSTAHGKLPHGFLILGRDSAYAAIKATPESRLVLADSIIAPSFPLVINFPPAMYTGSNPILQRQSFLGLYSDHLLANIEVGLVGLGGGGSHLAQQLVYLGVRHFRLFDYDHITLTNHNRLIGGYFSDIENKTKKVEIARRLILQICPDAVITVHGRWEDDPQDLQACDVVFGSVDTYQTRSQLEAVCRRYLQPYIDIGMDVNEAEGQHQASGQVILSLPGGPCMRCMNFITEANLAKEAANYGGLGGRPQVVWSNGVLASSAVGIFTNLLTGWAGQKERTIYLVYDGNTGHISDHMRLKYTDKSCVHFSASQSGKPRFVKL